MSIPDRYLQRVLAFACDCESRHYDRQNCAVDRGAKWLAPLADAVLVSIKHAKRERVLPGHVTSAEFVVGGDELHPRHHFGLGRQSRNCDFPDGDGVGGLPEGEMYEANFHRLLSDDVAASAQGSTGHCTERAELLTLGPRQPRVAHGSMNDGARRRFGANRDDVPRLVLVAFMATLSHVRSNVSGKAVHDCNPSLGHAPRDQAERGRRCRMNGSRASEHVEHDCSYLRLHVVELVVLALAREVEWPPEVTVAVLDV